MEVEIANSFGDETDVRSSLSSATNWTDNALSTDEISDTLEESRLELNNLFTPGILEGRYRLSLSVIIVRV